MNTKISRQEARYIALHAQGLDRDSPFGKGKAGALKSIQHLGYVQLDTLSVVARAHHHTLWTRTNDYNENHLGQLVKEKKVFEYWSHAAAYMPMEDLRFSLVRKETFRKGRSHWFKKDKKIMQYVLDRIKAEGALQSKDFENAKERGSWFDWKPAKNALEQLFQDGTLMVSARKGFQKMYDLAENVIPAGVNMQFPSADEYAGHLIKSTLRAHGFASAKEMAYLQKGMSGLIQKTLRKMLQSGELIELHIEGLEEMQYSFSGVIEHKPVKNSAVRLLSPFDNAVIKRQRLKNIFNFDYGIECYLPEHKRKFGYFCLPILYGNEFVGRLDPKADRHQKQFIVKNLYLESPLTNTEEFVYLFGESLRKFAQYNDCDKIIVEKFPQKMSAKTKTMLKKLLTAKVC